MVAIKVIGPGGLYFSYKNKPTKADIKEAEKYISNKLEGGATFTRFTTPDFKEDPEAEAKAYREFLKKD